MELPVIKCNTNILAECHEKTLEMGVQVFRVSLNGNETVTISWKVPYLDGCGIWHPRCGFNRYIGADWDNFLKSMTASSAPMFCIFNENRENRYTLAVSETKEIMDIRAGIHEEDGTLLLQVQVPASYLANGEKILEVRLDTRQLPFYRAIQEVAKWWEQECEITAIQTPGAAKDPVYSTWYSYHQKLKETEILEECRLAAELGFKTVILDDGWQTDDENRGYAFCGDWEVSKNRFPDFAGHIQKVHDMGMLSGKTAVHSDPLMWHVLEKPELAAIQVISSIFATPQISLKMRELSEDMRSMLKFWLEFMQKNKSLLQDEPICALEPQNLYPVVWTQKKEKAIIAVYSEERIIKIPDGVTECVILNGTKGNRMALEPFENMQTAC